MSSSPRRASFLEDPEEGLDIYEQTQLEKGRGGVTVAPSANPAAQKLMQCVLSAGFQCSPWRTLRVTLCAARALGKFRDLLLPEDCRGKGASRSQFGLNAKESANSGTCPTGFSAGFQTFLLTGTDVRKIPGLIEKFSFFPGNKLSFRTRGTNPVKFPFSWKPDTVSAPQPEAPTGSRLPLPEGRSWLPSLM